MDKYVDKILDDISQNVITDTTLIKSASPSSIIIDEDADREKIIYDLKKKDINLYTIDQFSSTLKTIMSGDVSAKDAVDLQYLSINKIKAAIDWILALGDDELKSMLSTEAWKLNYRIKPPTPEEFLTRTYIGNQADSIHPWIRDTFLKFFNPLSPYRNLILSSCIGTGKSTITVLVNLYIATLFALMYRPYAYFGGAVSTQYTCVYAGWTQKKASELLLEPMFNVLRDSDFFQQARTYNDMLKANKLFETDDGVPHIYWTKSAPTSSLSMSNGLNFKIVCSPGDIIGQNIICGSMTELAFFTDNGWSDQRIKNFFTKLRDRIDSRMKNDYMGRFILDSSPNTMESVIDQYIWEVAPKEKKSLLFTGARWDFFYDDFNQNCFYEGTRVCKPDWELNFPMFKGGNGSVCHVISNESEYANVDPIDVLWCPRMGGGIDMLDKAKSDPIEFLRDWAGLPSGAADRIFYQKEYIENIFDNKLKNVYNSITAPAEEEPEHLIWNQIRDQFFNNIFGKYYFYYNPDIPRSLSVDQSIAGDATCISMSHVERDKELKDSEGEPLKIFVTDFTIVIIPKGGFINLDAIKYFIIDLIQLGNISLSHVSFDAFQSDGQRQFLKRHGINVDYLSVDKTNEHYLSFIDYVKHSRVKCGKNLHYKNNLKSLQMVKRKGTGTLKVDHILGQNIHAGDENWDTSRIGENAKDAADSVVASIALLNKYPEHYIPYTVWDGNSIKDDSYEGRKSSADAFAAKMGLVL